MLRVNWGLLSETLQNIPGPSPNPVGQSARHPDHSGGRNGFPVLNLLIETLPWRTVLNNVDLRLISRILSGFTHV
jgi:hypothetical protein